jgi:hypothetical protein
MKIKTIAKNRTKLIDRIFEESTRCIVFTLDDGFIGRDVESKYAREALTTFPFAKLTTDLDESGTFTVQIHSNKWYDIKSPVGV